MSRMKSRKEYQISKQDLEKVFDYLCIQRGNGVSLRDIEKAAKLDAKSTLEILSELSVRGMIFYEMAPRSEWGEAYLNKFNERIINNFLNAYKQSSSNS